MSQSATDMIENQTRDQDKEDVSELSLDKAKIGKFSKELATTLENFPNLMSLSLNECEITSLENFPKLKKLVRIELLDNKITGTQLKYLTDLQDLQSLSLGGNLIKTFKDLEVLKQLPQLFQLDFSNNDVAQVEDYREKVFNLIPSLGILDNKDSKGEEVQYDDDDEDIKEGDDDEDEDDDDEDDDDVKEVDDEDDEDDEDDDEYDEEDDSENNDQVIFHAFSMYLLIFKQQQAATKSKSKTTAQKGGEENGDEDEDDEDLADEDEDDDDEEIDDEDDQQEDEAQEQPKKKIKPN